MLSKRFNISKSIKYPKLFKLFSSSKLCIFQIIFQNHQFLEFISRNKYPKLKFKIHRFIYSLPNFVSNRLSFETKIAKSSYFVFFKLFFRIFNQFLE